MNKGRFRVLSTWGGIVTEGKKGGGYFLNGNKCFGFGCLTGLKGGLTWVTGFMSYNKIKWTGFIVGLDWSGHLAGFIFRMNI